jgi:hypothetical protein
MNSNISSNSNSISSTKSSSSSSDQEEEETDASSSSSSLIPSSHLLSSLPPKKYIKEQRGNKDKNKMIRNPDYDEYMKKAAKQRIMHDGSISIVDDSSINCPSTTISATSAIINRTDTANKVAAITSTRRNSRSIEDNVVEDEYDIPNDIPPPANKKEDTEISATACSAIREDESAATVLNMKTISIADASGSDLPTSLLAPAYDCKLRGKFHYMASTNILSYIIKEKTGLSPRQFGAKYVFPLLGIDNTKLKWDQNNDGIETSYSQLKVTTIMMCKVAQLHLQEGHPSPEVKVPLLSKEYINQSTYMQKMDMIVG